MVHVPAGRLLNITLPVAILQVGWVIVPTVGAEGVDGCVLMTTSEVAGEIHPAELVTVKLYVPAASPEMVVLEPEPAIEPGLIVQLPAGRPLSTTLPVAREQVG